MPSRSLFIINDITKMLYWAQSMVRTLLFVLAEVQVVCTQAPVKARL